MRLSLKPHKIYNIPSFLNAPPHVKQKHNCNCNLTPQVNYTRTTTTQPYSQNISPKKWESFIEPVFTGHGPGPSRIADRWMEYMGVEDWAGLLDPLDDNLRTEIIRYGSFVEAAYRAFNFDPSSESYGSCKYPKKELLEECGFPSTGYRATCNLRASSGIQVPDWAKSSWSATTQSSWIGYVAVCHNKAVIDRLGRRDVVIALRGTATCLEWLENLRATLTPIPWDNNVVPSSDRGGAPMVESGFLSLYTSGSETQPSLQDTLRSEIQRILNLYPDEQLSFTITGHSLGAALATLAAHDIKTTFSRAPLVTVMSFGGPRVGNRSFRSTIEKQGTKVLRIVNPNDLITKVPGFVTDNNEINSTTTGSTTDATNKSNNSNNEKLRPLAKLWPNWMQKRVQDPQWVYAEVGHELRLTMPEPEHVPHYLSNMNLAKCHDLKTYLQLVAEGVTSNCPIRASLRRKRLDVQNLPTSPPITV
ncbi:phospholipase A(1) DAD1, chloroplastic [Silene latifolia]|uniref:phospholipase A(1) DAD1, chloroplastic n=1 Tax=Silene latifolia TaxID=37657 RepID=UPI003D779165